MSKDTNNKLRGWMAEHGMSQTAFAAAIDMPPDTFKVKITGKTEWKLGEIKRILKFTGQEFSDIF